ncbi:MAG: aminotransferase class I/II-fold pyridoxal phosphate-dependent enzyme, partial [Acidimicrobiales bacterium]
DLSMSLNPFAPDPSTIVRRHLADGALSRYPDRADLDRATAALAEVLSVDRARVLVTNGGAEAIALVAAELVGGWVDEPDFSLYSRHIPRLDRAGARFRSDPHNPTGRLADRGARAEVWDEAFYALATGRWSAPGRSGSIVLGSLTKVLACPGLRIGYVVTPEDDGEGLGVPGLRGRLARRQPQWAVGPLALAAIPDLLASADLAKWSRALVEARAELNGALRARGLEPMASDANFVLVPGVPGLREALATQGIVVRDCGSFGLADHVRIAVPDRTGLDRLEAALDRSGPLVSGEGPRR